VQKEVKLAEQAIVDHIAEPMDTRFFVEGTSIAQAVALRLSRRTQVRRCIIYPHTTFKIYWDYFMTL
jgi:hypothetical protein